MTNLYIITGSSRGLGLAMAQQLMKPGNHLLCMARNDHPQLEQAAQSTKTRLTQWMQDLTQGAEAAKRLTDWLAQQPNQGIDSATLINNAAMLPTIAPLRETGDTDIANVLRIGLEAPMLLTAAFLRGTAAWKQSNGAASRQRVMNISSGLGRNAMASQTLYCAAKAGLDHFTRCLALEEANKSDGAQVCSIAPGVIDTDMQIHLRETRATAFADRARFVDLKNSGQLSSPAACAAKLLKYLESPAFGSQVIADIRELA